MNIGQIFSYVIAFVIAGLWLIIGAYTTTFVVECFANVIEIEFAGKVFCGYCSVVLYVFVSWFVWDHIKD